MADTRFARLRAEEALAWLQARPDALVLDARDASHHAQGHVPGCIRLDGRNHEALLLRGPKSRPVLVYCYHGNASQTWAQMFCDFGFSEVADVLGGWTALDLLDVSGAPQALPTPPTPQEAEPGRPAATPVAPALAAWLDTQGFNPAQPDAPGQHGNTPLMHAAWRGARAMVDALLAAGVSREAVNSDGNNALWLACVHGEPGLMRTLVENGVPLNHANLVQATALMYAASAGKPVVLATLLALGADTTLQSQDGFTALDMAASRECLQLLRAATRSTRPAPTAA